MLTKRVIARWTAFAAIFCLFFIAPSNRVSAAPASEEIVIVTSFPSSLYEPFRRAFEQQEPGFRLRILNRKTTAAISMVAEGRFAGADVFWASAPDAFEVLKGKGLLLPLATGADIRSPTIGGFPVDDPDGLFRGFSVSGYGITWNNQALARHGLEAPDSISELVSPRYRGLIAMSAPSRSGTTHLMVETVLQRQGWAKGWQTWLGIAANLATVTARSFSVTSGVAQGRFAIGLSIDFLGRAESPSPHAATAAEIGFAYPTENAFLPASIGVLRGGANQEGAARFAAFVLSKKGQELLLDRRIGRQPVAHVAAKSSQANLFDLALVGSPGFIFDAKLSGTRYELVNLLFDELITDRLGRLQRFWRAHWALAERANMTEATSAEHTELARLMVELPPAIAALDGMTNVPALKRIPRGFPAPAEQVAFINMIATSVEAHLTQMERRLELLTAALPDVSGSAEMRPR